MTLTDSIPSLVPHGITGAITMIVRAIIALLITGGLPAD